MASNLDAAIAEAQAAKDRVGELEQLKQQADALPLLLKQKREQEQLEAARAALEATAREVREATKGLAERTKSQRERFLEWAEEGRKLAEEIKATQAALDSNAGKLFASYRDSFPSMHHLEPYARSCGLLDPGLTLPEIDRGDPRRAAYEALRKMTGRPNFYDTGTVLNLLYRGMVGQ